MYDPSNSGKPEAVRNEFASSKLGWKNPQHPAGPPLYVKFNTKSGFALLIVPVAAAA